MTATDFRILYRPRTLPLPRALRRLMSRTSGGPAGRLLHRLWAWL